LALRTTKNLRFRPFEDDQLFKLLGIIPLLVINAGKDIKKPVLDRLYEYLLILK
tara:strand:+ start:1052 stop:1213 length:162 start_codon:yes stop_codon:yes gene_type:complete